MQQILDAQGQAPAPSVMVGVPSGDHVTAGFANDLALMTGMTMFNRPALDLKLRFNKGTLLCSQRTGLVMEAVAEGCSHLLFLDSDMRFPGHTLMALLDHGKPIVGVNYSTRRHPVRPTAFLDLLNPKDRLYTPPGAEGLVEVQGLGFGAVLLDLDIFRYVPPPWFSIEWRETKADDGSVVEGYYLGEDLFFCDKMRKAGIPALVDQGLSQHIRHEGSWEYSHAHTLAAAEVTAPQSEAVHTEGARGPDHELHDAPSGA